MKYLLLAIIVFTSTLCYSQKEDKKLQKEISELVKGYNGDIGIYIRDLKKGKSCFNQCRYYIPDCKHR